jgi:hypothetical protein
MDSAIGTDLQPAFRVVTAFLLLVFAAGLAVEACAPGGATPAAPAARKPGDQPTIAAPDGPAKAPSGTVEVPPPID